MKLSIDQINDKLHCEYESINQLFCDIYPEILKSANDASVIVKPVHEENKLLLEILSMLIKPLVYPLIVLLFCVLLMAYFVFGLSHMIQGMLADFSVDLSQLTMIKLMFSAVIGIVVILIIVLLLLLILYRKQKVWIWILASKWSKVFRIVNTIRFINVSINMFEITNDTRYALIEIKSIFDKSILSWLTYHIHSKLEVGLFLYESFDSHTFDETLSMMLLQCQFEDKVMEVFRDYKEHSKEVIRKEIQTGSRIIMLLAYIAVALTLYGFYTALMIPMKIMEVL